MFWIFKILYAQKVTYYEMYWRLNPATNHLFIYIRDLRSNGIFNPVTVLSVQMLDFPAYKNI